MLDSRSVTKSRAVDTILPGVTFLTACSAFMAEAYQRPPQPRRKSRSMNSTEASLWEPLKSESWGNVRSRKPSPLRVVATLGRGVRSIAFSTRVYCFWHGAFG
jgi:hypothetical protein